MPIVHYQGKICCKMRRLLFAVFFVSMALPSFAIPARKGLLKLSQPDGTVVEAEIHGDEYHHFLTTPTGEPIVDDGKGAYVFGTLQPDGTLSPGDMRPGNGRAIEGFNRARFLEKMSEQSLRSPYRAYSQQRLRKAVTSKAKPDDGKGYGLFPGTSFPSVGKPHALVLLVEYADVKFRVDDPHDYFSRMVNERGFSDLGATGSALDFFIENSNGLFEPQFDVLGPVTLSGTQAYYGENKGSNDARPHMMAIEGCRLLDKDVDFSKYDNDGDGVIDNVFIFFAGEAESSTGVADQVWPHTGFVSYKSSVPEIFDGVRLDRYACSNEWTEPHPGEPGVGRPDGIGTFVHEFSHVMGLPDLYATVYNKAFTPGRWSTLDYGPYNNDGCTPPNYSVFERYALGWLQPRELTGASNVRLEEISRNQAAIIPTFKDTEFFLLENRQQTGWDKYIPGHGLLIWHIDYDEEKWYMNAVNNTVAHQNVDIEEADGMATEETRADDAFPGGLMRTSFTDGTIPSMLPWTGRSVNRPITDITEREDGVVTFKVAGGRPDVEVPVAAEAKDITPGGFTASWSAVDEEDCTYALSVFTRTGSGMRGMVYVPGYDHKNVGDATSYIVTGLKSDTQYYYMVNVVVKAGESEPSNEVAVRTEPPTFDYMAPVALAASDIKDCSFTANWEEMPDAVEYFLTVTSPVAAGALKDICGFDGGLSDLPSGWSTTANSTYSMASYCGAAKPSLRMTAVGQYIETAKYDDGISGFSFWMRGSSVNDGATVEVYGCDASGAWSVIKDFAIATATGGTPVEISDIPEDFVAMRIVNKATKGSVAIDDVCVAHGTAYVDAALPAYDSRNVGNVLSYPVEGLEPLRTYSYSITAGNGAVRSLVSETISVETLASSGVDDTTVSPVKLTVSGRTVAIDGLVEGEAVMVDIVGRRVAAATIVGGHATMTAPSAGVYIISCNGTTIAKTIIK